jgi:hypothetical protein
MVYLRGMAAYLIYPTRWYRKFAIAVDCGIHILGVASIILLPVYLFTYMVWVIQAVAMLALLYATAMSVRGVIKEA